MSIKEPAKSILKAVRISPALDSELKVLKINFADTVRRALYEEVKRIRKFYAIKKVQRSD